MNPGLYVALGVWLAGSLVWTALAATRVVRFHRALRHAEPASEGLAWLVRKLARRIGLARPPSVLVVAGAVSPMVWAIGGRARLIVPAGLLEGLSAEQRDSLLLHELAHIARRDHWVRVLEFAASAVYWWHPAVWLARRGLREAEEQCCDAWVVRASPEGRREYATALLAAVDFLSDGPALPPAASGLGDVSDLKRRLTMIMEGETPRGLGGIGKSAIVALAGLLLPLLPAWADGKGEKGEGGKGEKAGKVIKVEGEDGVRVIILHEEAAEDGKAGKGEKGEKHEKHPGKHEAKQAAELKKQLDKLLEELSERGLPAADLERAKAELNAAVQHAAAAEAMARQAAELKAMEAARRAAAEAGAVDARIAEKLFNTRMIVGGTATSAAPAAAAANPAAQAASAQAIRDEIELLEAQLAGKKAQLAEAEARQRHAAAKAARLKKMAATGAASAEDLETAVGDAEIFAAQAEAKRAAVREAEIRIKQAHQRLNAIEKARAGAGAGGIGIWTPGTAVGNVEYKLINPEVRVTTTPEAGGLGVVRRGEYVLRTHPGEAVELKPGQPLELKTPPAVVWSTVRPESAPAADREKRLADLEARLQALLNDVKALRGTNPYKAPAKPGAPVQP